MATKRKAQDEIKALLKRIELGKRVGKHDKIILMSELLQERSYTNVELSKLLRVAVRSVSRYRAELRERVSQDLRELDLAGELYAEYDTTKSRIDRAIEAEDWPRVKALRMRWSVVESFGRLAIPAQLDQIAELLEKMKEEMHLNDSSKHG